MCLLHTALLKCLGEKLGRNELRIVWEVSRFRVHVNLRFQEALYESEQRGKNSVRRTFMMKKASTCLTADETDQAVKEKSDIQMYRQSYLRR